METLLYEESKKLNIELTKEMLEKFLLYKNLLKEWNEKINLTAITNDKDIVIKHFIDSLTIEKYIPRGAKLIDIGTGAGFPGVPLKIVRSDVDVVLLDSLNKRVKFLKEIIDRCELNNIIAIHGRAEEIAHEANYREKFDIVTARAVANISTLSEYCAPFVKIGGKFICMKADADDEIKASMKAVEELGMKKINEEQFKLNIIDSKRTIIIYEKIKITSKKYPRKAGIPAKSPII